MLRRKNGPLVETWLRRVAIFRPSSEGLGEGAATLFRTLESPTIPYPPSGPEPAFLITRNCQQCRDYLPRTVDLRARLGLTAARPAPVKKRAGLIVGVERDATAPSRVRAFRARRRG